MKWLEKFYLLSRGKQISLVVCLIHFVAILGLLTHHLASWRFKPARPMVVRTVIPHIEKAAPKTSVPKATVAKPVEKPKPTVSKPAAKKVTSPVIVAQKAPENRLLKEITESLETIRSESKSSRSTLTIPSTIKKTEIASDIDPTYGEFLIAYLQNALDLPEYGEVKAKIEIDRFGHLVNCEILKSKSVKNAEFLKNRLPELTFPCLNDGTQVFTITFRNVEIR